MLLRCHGASFFFCVYLLQIVSGDIHGICKIIKELKFTFLMHLSCAFTWIISSLVWHRPGINQISVTGVLFGMLGFAFFFFFFWQMCNFYLCQWYDTDIHSHIHFRGEKSNRPHYFLISYNRHFFFLSGCIRKVIFPNFLEACFFIVPRTTDSL